MGTIIQVAMGLSAMTNEQLAQTTESTGTKMKGNGDFPSPPVDPAVMIKQASVLRTAVQAQADAKVNVKAATATLKSTRQATIDMNLKQGNYVAVVASGDGAKAKSVGMTLKAKATHPRTLPAPKAPSATLGNAHEVELKLSRRATASQRRVEMTTDPSKVDSWIVAGTTTGPSLVVGNLPTGAHSFRVIAVNGDRVSPPSGVVTIFVP